MNQKHDTTTMNDEISHRIERLEDRDRVNSVLVGTLGTEIQSMGTRLLKMEKVLEQVRDRVLSMEGCPAPGLCFQLQSRLGAVETQLATFKEDRAVLVKGWKAVGIVCAVATAVVTAVYGLWNFIEHVVHRKP